MTQHIGNPTENIAKGSSAPFQYTLRMLVLYFLLTFVITWAILIPTLQAASEDRQLPLIILSAFGPFIAAVIAIWTSQGRTALRQWLRRIFRVRIPVLLYLGSAFLLPFVIGVLHYGLYRFLGGRT